MSSTLRRSSRRTRRRKSTLSHRASEPSQPCRFNASDYRRPLTRPPSDPQADVEPLPWLLQGKAGAHVGSPRPRVERGLRLQFRRRRMGFGYGSVPMSALPRRQISVGREAAHARAAPTRITSGRHSERPLRGSAMSDLSTRTLFVFPCVIFTCSASTTKLVRTQKAATTNAARLAMIESVRARGRHTAHTRPHASGGRGGRGARHRHPHMNMNMNMSTLHEHEHDMPHAHAHDMYMCMYMYMCMCMYMHMHMHMSSHPLGRREKPTRSSRNLITRLCFLLALRLWQYRVQHALQRHLSLSHLLDGLLCTQHLAPQVCDLGLQFGSRSGVQLGGS